MSLNTLNDYFVDQLRDLYDAEDRVIRFLEKTRDLASSARLKGALERHIDESRRQTQGLDEVFKEIEEPPGGKTCLGIRGIIEEGEEMLSQNPDGAVRDAGIISTIQKIKHYEMATYGCVAEYASKLGEKKASDRLGRTLSEEKRFDEELTSMAENSINSWAAQS
jgi:ferritin-like metal-binding protein YciE